MAQPNKNTTMRLRQAYLSFVDKYEETTGWIWWKLRGSPPPPPSVVKRRLLRAIGKQRQLNVFVETGTYLGHTLAFLESHFESLHSIELSDELYREAALRFEGSAKIRVWHGDSGRVISDVLRMVDAPALFWLDGHYSGGITAKGDEMTPIKAELEQISRHRLFEKHVVVIDDMRLFGVDPDYPKREDLDSWIAAIGFNVVGSAHDLLFLSKDAEAAVSCGGEGSIA